MPSVPSPWKGRQSADFTPRTACRVALDFCRIRHAIRARWCCCSEYQMGAYSSSSSNDSKNASATILNCESSDFSPPLRGRAFPSNGHETMLLPSRSLGSLGCGDETGGWRSRSLQYSDEFCNIKSVHTVAGRSRTLRHVPALLSRSLLSDWYQ